MTLTERARRFAKQRFTRRRDERLREGVDPAGIPEWDGLAAEHAECGDGFCACREKLIAEARLDISYLQGAHTLVFLRTLPPTLVKDLDEQLAEAVETVRETQGQKAKVALGFDLALDEDGCLKASFSVVHNSARKGDWMPGARYQETLPIENTDAVEAEAPTEPIVGADPLAAPALPFSATPSPDPLAMPALGAGEEILDAEIIDTVATVEECPDPETVFDEVRANPIEAPVPPLPTRGRRNRQPVAA